MYSILVKIIILFSEFKYIKNWMSYVDFVVHTLVPRCQDLIRITISRLYCSFF